MSLRSVRRSLRTQLLVYGAAAFVAATVLSHFLSGQIERVVEPLAHAHVVLLVILAVLLLIPLWVFVTRAVLGPIERIVRADRAVLEGREGVIPEETIPGSELGEVMRTRNEMLLHVTALRTRAERLARWFSGLHEITAQASRSLELDKTLQGTLDKVLEVLGMDAGGFYLLEADGETLRLRASRGSSAEFVDAVRTIRLGEGVSGEAARQRRAVAVERSSYPTARLAPIVDQKGFYAMASAPVLARGALIGTLNVATRTPRAFTEEELSFLEAVGQEIGQVVENVRSVEAVRRAKTEWEVTFDAIATPIILIGPDKKIRRSNRALAERLGTSPVALVGRQCSEVIHGLAEAPAACPFRQVMESGLPATVMREEPRLGGTFLFTLFPLLSEGRTVECVHVMTDITALKRSQAELLRLKQLSDNILASVPSALLVLDRALRVRAANRSFYELFGLTREKTEGRGIGDVLPVPALGELVGQVMEDRSTPSCEIPFLSARGERILRVTATGMRIAEAEAEPEAEALLVIDDVSEQKLADERVRQSEKLATLGELISGVAHELNNPLTVIVGSAQLLQDAAEVPDRLKERLGRIRSQAERAARIVNTLLTFARRAEPKRTRVAVPEVLERALGLFAYQLRVAGIEVATDLAPDLPVVFADADQLQQVFVNLIKNAIDAMAGAAPPRTLRFRAAERDGWVRLEFADSGPGISKAVLGRLFEPFFTTKPAGQGTGLGLSISYGIVKAHGGEIYARSREGEGATFVIELPVGPPVEEPEPGPREQAQGEPAGTRILVVDDEPEVLATFAEALTALGHRVETASGGRQALEAIAAGRPYDFILVDLRMPELDGRGLWAELARTHSGLLGRVVFTTGDVLSPATQAFLEASGRPCLAKPFTVDGLRQVLRQVLSAEAAPGGGAV